MANPQKENGYTAIANELLEQLVKACLLGSEYKIVLFVIRKTYGFHKKEDKISLSQFQEGTDLSRVTVVKTLKNLIIKGILVKSPILAYKVNKDWEKWKLVNTLILVKSKGKYGIHAYTETGKDAYTHKRNKENKRKDFVGTGEQAPKLRKFHNGKFEE